MRIVIGMRLVTGMRIGMRLRIRLRFYDKQSGEVTPYGILRIVEPGMMLDGLLGQVWFGRGNA